MNRAANGTPFQNLLRFKDPQVKKDKYWNIANAAACMERLDRIASDSARMNGEPCIRNLRLTVRRVLEALAVYPDRAELRREYPELEDEDIRQALAFASANIDDEALDLPAFRSNFS